MTGCATRSTPPRWAGSSRSSTRPCARRAGDRGLRRESGATPAACAPAPSYLHQVHGTLRMVELYAPAMVAEEMERLALRAASQRRGRRSRRRLRRADARRRAAARLPGAPAGRPPRHPDRAAAAAQRAARGARRDGPERERAVLARPRPSAAGRRCRRRRRCRARAAAAWPRQQLAALRDALARWPEDGAPADIAAPGEGDRRPARQRRPRSHCAACCGSPRRSPAHCATARLPPTKRAAPGVRRRRARSAPHVRRRRLQRAARRTRRRTDPPAAVPRRPQRTAAHPALDALRETFDLARAAAQRGRTRACPRQPERPQPRAARHRRRRRSRKTCCGSRTRSTCTCAPARPTSPTCSRRSRR